MKRLTLLPGLLFLMLQAAFSQESGSCKPVNLVCDYLVNPLGIDNPAPRLSWMLNDARKGARQTACQVIVDKDSLELIAGKGTIWDSGKKDSEQILITYSGQELRPFTKYYWRVNVWDKDGVKSSSAKYRKGKMRLVCCWAMDGIIISQWPCGTFIVHLGVTVLLSVWMCGLLMRMVLLKSFLRSGTGKLHPAH